MAPDAARSVPNAARLVRDAAAIGARWCEIARDAARSVRDGVRSVRVLCVGSRNLHRHTHHTRTAQANTQHPQRLPYNKNGQRFPRGASPCLLYFVCLCCPGTKPWTAVSTDRHRQLARQHRSGQAEGRARMKTEKKEQIW